MPQKPSKHFILLSAYEELTQKETFCIGESNFEAVVRVQEKKRSLLAGLAGLAAADLAEADRAAFSRRVEALREQEDRNAEALDARIKDNRLEYRKLTMNAKSAPQLIRAYAGRPRQGDASRDLKGRA